MLIDRLPTATVPQLRKVARWLRLGDTAWRKRARRAELVESIASARVGLDPWRDMAICMVVFDRGPVSELLR